MATVFRLSHRGQTAGKRAAITQRGFVATRLGVEALTQQLYREALQTQIEYFDHHQDRMKYQPILAAREAVKAGRATAEQVQLANQPLGSGAIESTCRQYQCRFKRTGQLGTTVGDEALLCLETYWRNNRWHELFPHAQSTAALN